MVAHSCCIDVVYSKSIIKQGGNGGYTYEKFSMGQVVGIVNARGGNHSFTYFVWVGLWMRQISPVITSGRVRRSDHDGPN